MVERVAVGAVAEGGALVFDRLVQDGPGRGVQSLDSSAADLRGRRPRVDAAAVQDLARVQVADAGDQLLVEHGDLDLATGAGEPVDPLIRGDVQGIGAELVGQGRVHLAGSVQPDGAEPAAVPEKQFGPVIERPADPQVRLVRRIGHEHQPGHAGLDDEPGVGRQRQDDPLGPPPDTDDRLAGGERLQLRPVGRHLNRLAGALARIDAGDRAAFEVRPDAADHRFDFRQFGHGRRVRRPGQCVKRVGQVGRAGGAGRGGRATATNRRRNRSSRTGCDSRPDRAGRAAVETRKPTRSAVSA